MDMLRQNAAQQRASDDRAAAAARASEDRIASALQATTEVLQRGQNSCIQAQTELGTRATQQIDVMRAYNDQQVNQLQAVQETMCENLTKVTTCLSESVSATAARAQSLRHIRIASSPL